MYLINYNSDKFIEIIILLNIFLFTIQYRMLIKI